MTRGTLLAAFAHPDDEAFGPGGTLALYASRGYAVHLICATRGEAGSLAPEVGSAADLGAIREAELRCAVEALGLHGLHLLGYRDSGMPGSPDQDHPAAFIRAPFEEVVRRLVALIRELRPDVVLTFDPYGGYGHPDHIYMHRAVREAFERAGDPEAFPEHSAQGLRPHRPARLYYTVLPLRPSRLFLAILRIFGMDPRRFGRNRDIDLEAALRAALPVTTRIDVRAVLDRKERAAACHRSQGGGWMRQPRLLTFVRRGLWGVETFHRAIPPFRPGEPIEGDLFP
ncbi:PIG-L family deacetylase [Thermoflexus sp.]|uniref:PIG-L family deacetylase n=1 Tax=Thermoflexus sp. TaxID=1969742 RepID=UPI002ADD4012|nr:PIG-L family deacetylase [Thermoflexus sp.]